MSIMNHVEISVVRYGELQDYANELQTSHGIDEVVPIIRSRANALALNPSASPSDPALILARYQGKLVSYFGLFPAILRKKNVDIRVSFSTTGEGSRRIWGKGIAPGLLREGVKLVENFVATGNSTGATGAFRQAGFQEFNPTIATRLVWKQFDWGLKIQNWKFSISHMDRHRWREVQEVPRWAIDWIRRQEGYFFYRSPEVIQWMLRRPWFPESPPAEGLELRYAFHNRDYSVVYRIFEYQPPASSRKPSVAIFSIVKSGETSRVKLLELVGDQGEKVDSWWLLPALQLRKETGSQELLIPAKLHIPIWLNGMCSPVTSNYFVHSQTESFWDDFASLQTSLSDGDTCFW